MDRLEAQSGEADRRIRPGDQPGRFALQGRLDLDAARALQAALPASGPVEVDLASVTNFTAAGAALLLQWIREHPDRLRFRGTPPELLSYLRELPLEQLIGADPLCEALEEEPFLESAGGGWLEFVQAARDFLALALEFLYWVFVAPFQGIRLRLGRTATELNRVGIDAIPIVGLISVLIGVILALNAASQLEKYGTEKFTADLVGIALTREMSPVITAVLIAGRSGSAIAAEIATMVVTEEIDALRVMGINPRSFLLVPKLLALMLAMPALVILSMLVGMGGGFLVALTALDLPFELYWNETIRALHLADVLLGVIKAAVFGLLIGLTAETLGLRVRGGSAGVGRVTTASVVASFFLVIIFNALFTYLFYALDL